MDSEYTGLTEAFCLVADFVSAVYCVERLVIALKNHFLRSISVSVCRRKGKPVCNKICRANLTAKGKLCYIKGMILCHF